MFNNVFILKIWDVIVKGKSVYENYFEYIICIRKNKEYSV